MITITPFDPAGATEPELRRHHELATVAAAVGFTTVQRQLLQVLTVADVDPARWETPVPRGYRLERVAVGQSDDRVVGLT